jgi:hypothetical protein
MKFVSEVLTELLKIKVLWVVMLCCWSTKLLLNPMTQYYNKEDFNVMLCCWSTKHLLNLMTQYYNTEDFNLQ